MITTRQCAIMKRILIIVVWVLLAMVAWRYGSISQHHFRHYVTASGFIVRLHPDNHQSFDYLYVVSGTTYFGTANASAPGRNFTSLKPGGPLTVYYNVHHPGDSTAEPPAMRGSMSVWFFILVGTLATLGIILWSQTRRPARK